MNVLSVFERSDEKMKIIGSISIGVLIVYVCYRWIFNVQLKNEDSLKFCEELNEMLMGEEKEKIHYPSVFVDLKSFDKNVELIGKEMFRDESRRTTIRVASKSVRVPYFLDRILSFGYPYKGLMSYSVEETQFLCQMGFDDILIGYPSEQLIDYEILKDLHEKEKKLIRIIVDNDKSIEKLNHFLNGITNPFPILLEVDLSFRLFNGLIHIGARRSPIRTIDQLIEMIEFIQTLPNVRLEGLMVYESHIAGIGDINPVNYWLNPIIRLVKYFSIPKIQQIRKEMGEICSKYGLTLFNGGGTGSFLSTLNESAVLTEITVGSAFFQPHLFDHYQQNERMKERSNHSFIPSCYFALPIVRISDENQWITCAGGGYIASGKPGWDKVPIPVYPKGLTISHDEGAGEVQTPLLIKSKTNSQTLQQLKHNGLVFFRHAKGGEIAERFTHFLVVQDGKIVETPKTYRGFGKCFF